MSRSFCLLAAASVAAGACSPASTPPPPDEPSPSLVVLLVVDQLSQELLQRYAEIYRGGLRRLLDQGLTFVNATHDHAATVTAVGHATLGTGVYPTRHGIVGNEWVERDGEGWREVYSVSDPSATILGHPDLEGMGPANVLREGLASWILSDQPEARVVSIAKKERAAIALAAQARGEVYWLPEEAAGFTTSTAYTAQLPEWVQRFNREEMPTLYSDTMWEDDLPPELARLSRPDTSRWESDRLHTAFPHRAGDEAHTTPAEINAWRWDFTPYPDRATVSMAIAAIDALALGQRQSIDFLGVGLSQTDRIGHEYGPGSREQLVNLLHLDAELERFFDALDREVGESRWVLALSADHGVLEIPEILADEGQPAGRVGRADREALAQRIASAATGGERAIRDAVSGLRFVAAAYSFEEIEQGPPADSFAVLFANSHSRTRITSLAARSGVYVRYPPQWLGSGTTGTTHGSANYYDRHVPLIFLGAGIPTGLSPTRVATVDVAPTLASVARVPFPADLDGRPIVEVVGP